ncbi:MAG: PfkB family carbohydrate kinase [Aquabacterium sp.]
MRPQRPRRIACVGHAALDHGFRVAALPAQPVKTPATSYHCSGGGMAFNAALALSRLGATVRLLSRVGDDAPAQSLRAQLAAEGVQVQGVETVAGTHTSVSAVVVDARGERYIFNHRGDALARAHALDPRQLAGADAVLADPRWADGAAAALRWARKHDLPAVLDADLAPAADLQRLVPLAGWAAFSQPGLAAFAPGLDERAALLQARASGCAVALVTRGAAGACWTRDGQWFDCPAPRVEVQDTTGAGDVFHGALTLALAEGQRDADAVAYACAAAALKCRRGPGVAGAPRRAELERFLRASAA